jgi:hypothetical protein
MTEIQDLTNTLRRSHSASFANSAAPERSDALSQIFAQLSSIERAMQRQQHDCFDIVRKDMELYKEKSHNQSDARNFQGWTVASLTLAGGLLAALSPLTETINDMNPTFSELIDSLGGVDSVKKLLDSSSHFTDGIKPVSQVWGEAKISDFETDKQYLELARQRGQQAADQSNTSVDKLLNAALRILDTDSKSKFN